MLNFNVKFEFNVEEPSVAMAATLEGAAVTLPTSGISSLDLNPLTPFLCIHHQIHCLSLKQKACFPLRALALAVPSAGIIFFADLFMVCLYSTSGQQIKCGSQRDLPLHCPILSPSLLQAAPYLSKIMSFSLAAITKYHQLGGL